MSRIQKILKWLKEPSLVTRGNTIVTWTLLTTIPIGGIYGFYQYLQERDELSCEQRVESRVNIRSVIVDIYDFAERFGTDENIQILRERLNSILPPLTLTECLEQ